MDLAERIETCHAAEDLAQEARFLAAGRGGAADEVEDSAILQAVEGNALDAEVFVEVDRRHLLVDDLLAHELESATGLLADVVPVPVADGGNGRGRTEGLEDLIAAHAFPDLGNGALIRQITAMEFLTHRACSHG